MATIPIDDIVPGATIRFTIINQTQFLSVRDFIMHVCGKDSNHASDLWRTLDGCKKSELSHFLEQHKFPGRGQQDQAVITFPGAIKLSMFLPGEIAKRNRAVMAQILTRYFAGDPSLIQEIEANAQSAAPIPQIARASFAQQPALEGRKRHREIDEFAEWERRTALKERQIAIKREEVSIREKEISVKQQEIMNLQTAKTAMDLLIPDWISDSRLKLQMEDWVKNTIFGCKPAITNGAPQPEIQEQATAASNRIASAPSPIQSISISQVVHEMGHRVKSGDLQIMGKLVAKAYRDKYNENPGKHRQWVDGAEREVNSYTERDRELLTSVVRQYVGVS